MKNKRHVNLHLKRKKNAFWLHFKVIPFKAAFESEMADYTIVCLHMFRYLVLW